MFSPVFQNLIRRPVVKIFAIIALLAVSVQFAVIVINNAKSSRERIQENQSIVIENIAADKRQNLINIQCSGKGIMNALAAGTLDIKVNIGKKDSLFENVYIKNIDTLSKNTLLLGIQPPLGNAFYGMEKRDVEVQLTTANETVKTSRTAVLGTAVQRLDLRAYSAVHPSKYLMHGIFLFLGLSAVFALAVPLLKKYRFKKHNIRKYKDITTEDKATLDPFTFEAFEEKDEVVVVDDNIILLRSWKRLKGVDEEERAEAFSIFFGKTEKSHLFQPLNETETAINRTWFAMAGAFTGWLFYTLLMYFDLKVYRSVLSAVFDTGTKQFSAVIYADLLLAIALGLGMGAMFLTADRIYGNDRFSLISTLRRFASGLLILPGFFVLQFLGNMYLINNIFFGQLLCWLCIGLGLALSFGRQNGRKKSLITAGITGLAGFIAYRLCSADMFVNTLSPEVILLISLLLTGGVLGALIHVKTAVQAEAPPKESVAVPDHHMETLAVEAGLEA